MPDQNKNHQPQPVPSQTIADKPKEAPKPPLPGVDKPEDPNQDDLSFFSKHLTAIRIGVALSLVVLIIGGIVGSVYLTRLNSTDNRGQAQKATNNCCEDPNWSSIHANDQGPGCNTPGEWDQGYHACIAGACGLCQGGASAGGCNNNGRCDAGEDHNNCPSDCSTGGTTPTAPPSTTQPTQQPAPQPGTTEEIAAENSDGTCPATFAKQCGGCLANMCVTVNQTCNSLIEKHCGTLPCYQTGTCESCAPESNRCVGDTHQTCVHHEGSYVWQTVSTNESELCSAYRAGDESVFDDINYTPVGGATLCEEGSRICTGESSYKVCTDGSNFEDYNCGLGETCSNGMCLDSEGNVSEDPNNDSSSGGNTSSNNGFIIYESEQLDINDSCRDANQDNEAANGQGLWNIYTCDKVDASGGCPSSSNDPSLVSVDDVVTMDINSAMGNPDSCQMIQADCVGTSGSNLIFRTKINNPGNCEAPATGGTTDQTETPTSTTEPTASEEPAPEQSQSPEPEPSDEPSPEPEESSFACLEIVSSNNNPVIGDSLTFTCHASGDTNLVTSYDFRYSIDNGAYNNIGISSQSENQSVAITITEPGYYQVQCRACDDNSCTQWQEAQQ